MIKELIIILIIASIIYIIGLSVGYYLTRKFYLNAINKYYKRNTKWIIQM